MGIIIIPECKCEEGRLGQLMHVLEAVIIFNDHNMDMIYVYA